MSGVNFRQAFICSIKQGGVPWLKYKILLIVFIGKRERPHIGSNTI